MSSAPSTSPVAPRASTGIRDNTPQRGTVGDFLRAELKAGADLDIVTAYFTVFAHDKLKTHLDNLGRIRLLFGEAAFIKTLDPEHKNGAAYVLRDDGLALASGLGQRHVARACADWIRDKVEVRSVTSTGFLHGKMSHIRRGEVTSAIVGSSNFTTRGLGLGAANNNVELNLVVDGNRDRADLADWFNQLWNDTTRVTDVKQAVLDYLLQVYRDQSPQFVYYKTLFELFRRYIDEGLEIDDNLRRIRLPDTGIWRALYSFQRDGARSAINKIKKFNGCILADSVGLGKTYTALAVIKYFELRNEKVLVLCPKKLKRNWVVYRQPSTLNPFESDRFRFDVLHHTDLSRDSGESNGLDLASLNWSAYDLVVIDESHNFRNNKLATQRPGEPERRTRYQCLMEDIISAGIRTKVLLLSATPVNNQLADLRNQIPEWLKAVREDRTQLQFLLDKTQAVNAKRDGKLAELRDLIAAKAGKPTVNRDGKPNRKVIVFTAFADTARYLHDNLSAWARSSLGIHSAVICGDGGNSATLGRTDFDDILTNFSPVAKRRSAQTAAFANQTDEIDLLIATDCISEGQNLQDCDLLVNYDIHWNPVRIIQRFGRIDRIGSRNDAVQLVNFWPVADLDRYLGVKHRVEARMALVDLAATQADNLLDTSQLEDLIKDDLLFRDRQLKRLKDEVLELEDLDESISLADFSLDEFRQDLLNFLQAHRAELERAPLGLYAVVPARHPDIPLSAPGVLYCLRQKAHAATQQGERINPLAPHYLVYVLATGEVRLAFTQAKTVLNLFRGLALGHDEPYLELCRLFDRTTGNGADMSHLSRLIASAVRSITSTFQQKLAIGLQGRRDFVLPLADEQPHDDEAAFDLVTWLVLHDGAAPAS